MSQTSQGHAAHTSLFTSNRSRRVVFTRICIGLWNSPTLTTWGRQLVSALRMVALTPLMLTRFNRTELACWFLFGTVNLLGDLVFTRLQAIFARMIAIALGGASDLSPIIRPGEKRGDGSPNWRMIYQLYATLGTIQVLFSFLLTAIALIIGQLSLRHLLRDYSDPRIIWVTFYVFIISSFLIFNFSKFGVALEGLNKVALTNRLNMIFDLLSLLSGMVALTVGGSILTLALVMQVFVLLGGLRGWLLLRTVDGGVMRGAPGYGMNRQILAWAWPPAWKGLISQFASYGVVQMSGIVLANNANVAMVGSYLFALRIYSMIQQFATAPSLSQTPVFSRLLSEGRLADLRERMLSRIRTGLLLFGSIALAAAVFATPILSMIKSRTPFIPTDSWLLLCFFALAQIINQQAASIAGLGNNILFYRENSVAAIITVLLLFFCARFSSMNAIIAMSFLPYLIILGLRPVKTGARLLQIKTENFTARTLLWPVSGYVIGSLLILSFHFAPDLSHVLPGPR
jgi:hypothetical protein